MTEKTDNPAPKGGSKRSLKDDDIATHARRSGPSGHAPGTDADSHSDADQHSDTDTAQTDHDQAATPSGDTASDADATSATDKDT